MDYYQILGVSKDATEDQVKLAFRNLAKECHPDRNPGDKAAEEKFKIANEAYEVLRDPQKRAQYELERAGVHTGPHGFHQQQPFGFTFNFDPHNPESIFDVMQGAHRRHQQKNRDLNIEVQITLEEIFQGKVYTLNYNAPDGTTRDINLTVPPGVSDDTRFRCPGKGDHSIKNLPPGDAFVILRIQRHSIFERRAQNLYMLKTITAIDAMLGMAFTVTGINGTELSVIIPAGSQHGDHLRVQGHGMTVHGIRPRGDLFIVVEVEIPRKLTPRQIELLREFNKPELDVKTGA